MYWTKQLFSAATEGCYCYQLNEQHSKCSHNSCYW